METGLASRARSIQGPPGTPGVQTGAVDGQELADRGLPNPEAGKAEGATREARSRQRSPAAMSRAGVQVSEDYPLPIVDDWQSRSIRFFQSLLNVIDRPPRSVDARAAVHENRLGKRLICVPNCGELIG
jgi:hypothetical protein